MRIRVDHRDITWLAVDQAEIVISAKKDMPAVVAKNVRLGARTEKDIARAASGPHGKKYFKRITSSISGGFSGAATSVYQGEWGPHGGGRPVGAGWRHGVNTDSQKSADIVGPKFEKDVSGLIADWFDARARTGR